MSSGRTRWFPSCVVLLVVIFATRVGAQFTPIAQPDAAYVANTSLLPITASDFSAVTSVTNGSVTASFDISLAALTVPGTWSSWGAPPNAESATPRVLWTNGFTTLTLTLSPPLGFFGLEAQPNTSVTSPITASFFNGMAQVGQIMRNVSGNGGALLFAATSTTLFDRVVLTSTDDFAIAQVRAGSPPPTTTPTATATVTSTQTPTVTSTGTPVTVGGACMTTLECTVGLFCVDGVCCTSPCDGPLQSCNVPPHVGTCITMAAPVPAMSPTGILFGFGALLIVAALGLRRAHGRTLLMVALLGAAASPAGGTTVSTPIAITPTDAFVWVVNPDNDSVSVLEVGSDVNLKRTEIGVGVRPRSVAITPNGQKVYVTNMVSGSVSVIDASARVVTRIIPVGREPFGCALSPDGHKLYVTNFSSDSLFIIDTASDSVIQTVSNIGVKPRGIAVTSDGGGNRVYVTQFLAQPVPNGVEGRDDGREGRVTFFYDAAVQTKQTIALNPIADTGFQSNGSVLDRIPATVPDTFTFTTGAFPNLLQSIVLKGNRAYLPNTGSSPNGPVRFNVNVQALLASFDLTTNLDTGETLNLNRGVQFEPVGTRLFNTNPIAIAFKQSVAEGFAVLAATDRLVRVQLDADGTPTINAPADAMDPGSIVRIPVGKNPQGIVLNATDTRAYVMNFISRDVSVVDIAAGATQFTEIARIASASLPVAGTQAAFVQRGQELFNTSVGPAGTQPESMPPAGRMSNFGWGSCYSCHPDGLSDGVTWMFADGPRQTISMEGTAEHPQPAGAPVNANGAPLLPSFKQRALNWSAVRDEIQDFELNIRGVSGGEGLIQDGQPVVNLQPTANTGRSADLDAIAAYIAFGIRAPISPRRPTNITGLILDTNVIAGRALFASANCQQCHGGVGWTRSQVFFTPPPTTPPVTITAGQIAALLNPVGTFDPNAFNEIKPDLTTANGALGFNTPSLLSVFAGAPYFHSGAAATLDDVLQNVTHRAAGTGGVDTLSNAADRALVVDFLQSIDAKTPTFP